LLAQGDSEPVVESGAPPPLLPPAAQQIVKPPKVKNGDEF